MTTTRSSTREMTTLHERQKIAVIEVSSKSGWMLFLVMVGNGSFMTMETADIEQKGRRLKKGDDGRMCIGLFVGFCLCGKILEIVVKEMGF